MFKWLYLLYWKGEIIDETSDYADALFLQGEYNMSYGGGVMIMKKRVSL